MDIPELEIDDSILTPRRPLADDVCDAVVVVQDLDDSTMIREKVRCIACDPVAKDNHANLERGADLATALRLNMYEPSLDIIHLLPEFVGVRLELGIKLLSSDFP